MMESEGTCAKAFGSRGAEVEIGAYVADVSRQGSTDKAETFSYPSTGSSLRSTTTSGLYRSMAVPARLPAAGSSSANTPAARTASRRLGLQARPLDLLGAPEEHRRPELEPVASLPQRVDDHRRVVLAVDQDYRRSRLIISLASGRTPRSSRRRGTGSGARP